MRSFCLHAFGFIMYLVLALLKVALVNFTLNKYIMMMMMMIWWLATTRPTSNCRQVIWKAFLDACSQIVFFTASFWGAKYSTSQLNSASQFVLVSRWAAAMHKKLAKWLVHATRADFKMCLISQQSMAENAIALSNTIANDWLTEALLAATDCETDAVWLTGWSDEPSDGWTGTWILFWTMFMHGTITVMQLKCWVTNATDATGLVSVFGQKPPACLWHAWDVFCTFFLWESHFHGSVVLTSSHEKCETRK